MCMTDSLARLEDRYGFWRGTVNRAVARYLDCGIFENGFEREMLSPIPEREIPCLGETNAGVPAGWPGGVPPPRTRADRVNAKRNAGETPAFR